MSHAREAVLLLENAQSTLDRESYRGDRYADAQAVATIALAHAVLAVADAINKAVAELPVSGR